MKYEVVNSRNEVVKTVENVNFIEHIDGYFYFNGAYNSENRQFTRLYVISDEVVAVIQKID